MNVYYNVPVELYRLLVYYSGVRMFFFPFYWGLVVKQSSDLNNTNQVHFNELLQVCSILPLLLTSWLWNITFSLVTHSFLSFCSLKKKAPYFIIPLRLTFLIRLFVLHFVFSYGIEKYKPKYSPEQIKRIKEKIHQRHLNASRIGSRQLLYFDYRALQTCCEVFYFLYSHSEALIVF